jgi:hypothetical protein
MSPMKLCHGLFVILGLCVAYAAHAVPPAGGPSLPAQVLRLDSPSWKSIVFEHGLLRTAGSSVNGGNGVNCPCPPSLAACACCNAAVRRASKPLVQRLLRPRHNPRRHLPLLSLDPPPSRLMRRSVLFTVLSVAFSGMHEHHWPYHAAHHRCPCIEKGPCACMLHCSKYSIHAQAPVVREKWTVQCLLHTEGELQGRSQHGSAVLVPDRVPLHCARQRGWHWHRCRQHCLHRPLHPRQHGAVLSHGSVPPSPHVQGVMASPFNTPACIPVGPPEPSSDARVAGDWSCQIMSVALRAVCACAASQAASAA